MAQHIAPSALRRALPDPFRPKPLVRLDHHITNLTRNSRLKLRQARRWIAEGKAAWVEPGISLRECSLAEVLAHRARQRELQSGLDPIEIHGCTYKPPASDVSAEKRQIRSALLRQAREFYNNSCAQSL